MEYLLDTNSVIYYLQGVHPQKAMLQFNKIVDDKVLISVITQIELLGFNESTIDEQNITKTFVDAALIFNLDAEIVKQTIELRKNFKIKLPDAIIAAIAIVYDLTVITRNTNDFHKIHSLKCIDPNLL